MRYLFTGIILVIAILVSACDKRNTDSATLDGGQKNAAQYQIALGMMDGIPPSGQQTFRKNIQRLAPNYGFNMAHSGMSAVLRGYFSAESYSEGSLSLYYVFDVLDDDGQRLHRVNGSITTNTTSREHLAESDYEKIAVDLLSKLQKWRNRR
ncbi:hypothetical protein [Bartonella sp. LJL80]